MALPERMTLGSAVRQRICDLVKIRYGSYRKLAAAARIPKSTLLSFMKGSVENLSMKNSVLVANAFGMSYREFIDCDYFDRIDILQLVEENKK